MTKIKFRSGSSSPFFQSLDAEVSSHLTKSHVLAKARRNLWTKMIIYSLVHASSYVLLFTLQPRELLGLIGCYLFMGLSGLLLGFNVSHDALHGSFSKNKRLNQIIYHLSFNIQGTSAYLWKIRHQSSHHIFPNVDGCDADIDDNPFIRLSPQHPHRPYQRFQHRYAILVYCFYTLHWFFFKDALYLFKKNVANLQNKKHPLKQKIFFFAWKTGYLFLLIGLPLLLGFKPADILLCFFIMHVVNSLAFILPGDYYTHQLATSLDYSPTSKFFNAFLGGFNAHAAHHLYPKLPHTIYPFLSPIIQQKAKEFGMPYHQLNLFQSVRSHYRYLKMMGNPPKKPTKNCNRCAICIKNLSKI
jgi:linoleoyl-CoA desaturase